jgi:hypothetical protein
VGCQAFHRERGIETKEERKALSKPASFRNRVIALMKEASNQRQALSRTQAEHLVWQGLEAELIHIPSSKTDAS